MIIRDMFVDDINRKINGVIKVDQAEEKTIEQELREYVITKELKKHFITFFNYYGDAFDQPTDDIGVWISGFFGSGKSHFLKMLSYLLENKEVQGKSSVEYFRSKFDDDPATFMMIEQATKGPTETILFNIDIEGSINKDATAVLRVFAKMFYKHLGFFGEDLKLAKLESYINQQGKTKQFCKAFEEKSGKRWLDTRKAYAFNGKYLVPTMAEVLDMSEDDAEAWFKDKTPTECSIAQLVEDINAYVNTKPDNFRLLFMIDEVGQYIGTHTDLLLNLQSLIEKIGSECRGKVWVVCTGQEALDEIIKVRTDEFSRIQARFKARLSLTSSSVDEVVQRRILQKTPQATTTLSNLYDKNDSVLRNLFVFSGARADIKGYTSSIEFATNFPFVPYQFVVMQNVFNEIRKHGNAGKHHSNGERSMLSGFQEAAQQIQDRDEYALVPFFLFYDTVHSFLDSSIRRVIERCQKAADHNDGLQQQDVNVLKLLYLIRYVDDIPANLDNIVILMADDIRIDKITLREAMRGSLDRLTNQNYIGRSGDIYNFLTDEEQDIQREINNTQVDISSVVERIAQMIYGDIFTTKKFRHGSYDFDFDKMVDDTISGALTGGMKLRFLTVATDPINKSELRLMTNSKENEAIVVLDETPYFESLEKALKIRKYVKQRNVSQLPKSAQDIIRNQQEEANHYEQTARDALQKAIINARFYADGEKLDITSGDAKSRIDQTLDYLVTHVYSELSLIDQHADSDADIVAILTGKDNALPGMAPNHEAAAVMEEYLEMQLQKNMPTSMADLQKRYSAIPYGWREIDIAAVAARLIHDQKATVKYAGATIQPDDEKLPSMLRKKSETGKTSISKHRAASAQKLREVKEFLRDYFEIMDVPDDENGIVRFIIEKFTAQKNHYDTLNARYENNSYPDHALLQKALSLTNNVLSQQKDNIALITHVCDHQDALYDNKEALGNVEAFFKNQVQLFDEAVRYAKSLQNDFMYLESDETAKQALEAMRQIITIQDSNLRFNYRRIPELNTLMATLKASHGEMLAQKREEVLTNADQCQAEIRTVAKDNDQVSVLLSDAESYFTQLQDKTAACESLALLDGFIIQMSKYKDDLIARIKQALTPQPEKPDEPSIDPAPEKNIKAYNRQILFQAKTLETEADIDAYVETIRAQLKQLLTTCDGIKLN